MCYGDVAHGRDGYYEAWVQDRIAEERQEQERTRAAFDAMEQDAAALDQHRHIQLTDRE